MIQLTQRIDAFAQLGKCFAQFAQGDFSAARVQQIENAAQRAEAQNPWFSYASIQRAFASFADMLDAQNLQEWLQPYALAPANKTPKVVALVLAGNIPFVGFHDVLCVLMSGHKVLAKLSSKDACLPQAVFELLFQIEPAFAEYVRVADNLRAGFDAVIATGSDNSARYFEQYFAKYPHIIRANRNSLAILRGDESEDELRLLADDVFAYFGLGCRSVSKLYLPKGFDLIRLFTAFASWESIVQHTKYMNNFDYYRAIFLMSQIKFESNGFAILKEAPALSSPISVIHVEYYHDLKQVHAQVQQLDTQIQCIVGKKDMHPQAVAFGESQAPKLWDYADKLDTMAFLQQL